MLQSVLPSSVGSPEIFSSQLFSLDTILHFHWTLAQIDGKIQRNIGFKIKVFLKQPA